MKQRFITSVLFGCAWFSLLNIAFAAPADNPFAVPGSGDSLIGRFDPGALEQPVKLSAEVVPPAADRPAVLMIRARIAVGQHAYSLSQPPGGPQATKIKLTPSADFRQLDMFRAYPQPHIRIEQGPVWTGLEIQEHNGEVTWYAPIEITAGVDPAALAVSVHISMQVCEDRGSCVPVDKELSANVAAGSELPAPIASAIDQRGLLLNGGKGFVSGEYQGPSSVVKFSGRLVPSVVRPGETARIELTATVRKGSRIYAHADRDNAVGAKPTLIAIDRTTGLVPHRPMTDAMIQTDTSVPEFGVMHYHEGTITWMISLDVPPAASGGKYLITGRLGYQACEESEGRNVCELPSALDFQTTLTVGSESNAAAAPVMFRGAERYDRVAAAAAVFADFLDMQPGEHPPQGSTAETAAAQADVPTVRSADQYNLDLVEVAGSRGSLGYYVALAFVGGLILNLMPCVLPVIGLKVMSFVEQAHKGRAHALALNLWFAAGIIAVFLLLGVLASLPQLGLGKEGLSWGGQFGSTAFNVAIAAVVFAMALSLLGVWEIPIPGFFGSGSVQSAAAKEGPLGAFLKGVVTTVLATPCTAPFMAAAIAWAVAQPVGKTMTVFASLGIGMASPYVLVGVYPELLRFLPRPGAWMETFKQVSGFVLLGTVVFILSFMAPTAVVPTLVLLLGVAVACWLVARTPLTAELRDRFAAWASAGAMVLVFLGVSFGWLYRLAIASEEGRWQPFSLERLKQVAVDEGHTVLVDFSAEWCLNCKVFEKTVLRTKPVEQAIASTGTVTMYGDYTNYPPEINRTLRALGANGVPVIAIFPGDAPFHPIVFRGGYTQQALVNALEQASSRRGASGSRSVAEANTGRAPLN